MRSFLYREQIRHRPETPQTIVELEVALMNYSIERFYKDTILSDNGYRAVLFTTDILLNALAAATEIFMNGTFSVSNIRDLNKKDKRKQRLHINQNV